jgi:hypothetical protein
LNLKVRKPRDDERNGAVESNLPTAGLRSQREDGMPTYTTPSFIIKVLLVGRKDVIESHSYGTREEAEADLQKITEARKNDFEVDLTWFQMPGNQVQAAYIEDRTTSVGFA